MGNPEHLTSRTVDLMVAGLLDAPGRSSAQAHLDGCASCAAKVAQAVEAKEQFLVRNPPALRAEELLARRRSPFWRALLAPGLATLAAATAVVLFVLPGAGEQPEFLSKGGGAVVAHVHRPSTGESWTGQAAPVRAGDVLQFHVDPGGLAHLAVFVVDARGKAQHLLTTQLPKPGPLPHSLVADGSLDPERIVFLLSEAALEEGAVARAIEASFRGLEAEPDFAPPGGGRFRVHSVLIRKEG